MTTELVTTDNAEVFNDNLIVIINGNEQQYNYENFGLTFESADSEIITAIAGAVQESFGVDINQYYKVNKVVNTRKIYVIPNSTAGGLI